MRCVRLATLALAISLLPLHAYGVELAVTPEDCVLVPKKVDRSLIKQVTDKPAPKKLPKKKPTTAPASAPKKKTLPKKIKRKQEYDIYCPPRKAPPLYVMAPPTATEPPTASPPPTFAAPPCACVSTPEPGGQVVDNYPTVYISTQGGFYGGVPDMKLTPFIPAVPESERWVLLMIGGAALVLRRLQRGH